MKTDQGKSKLVGSTASPKTRRDIHQSRQAIAHDWYYAFASMGSFQLDRSEALLKFSQLTDQVIAYLLAENPQDNVAKEIGANLASLPCLDPQAIEISGQLWSRQLVEAEFPVEVNSLYPRLLALLNGMSTGFFKQACELVLADQESIRSAMTLDLRRTTEELKRYQTKLEEMLAERTQDLQESEEKFRAIAETSIDGVIQSTDEPNPGTLIYVNEAFARMLGYAKKELLGRTTVSLLPEEDLPRISVLAKDIRDQRPVNGEFRLKHKDGHLVDITFSNVPTVLKGRIVRSAIMQDVTERKRVQEALFQIQERYRTLAEASPDMIFIVDPDDRIQYVNSFAAALINLPSSEIIGQARGQYFSSHTNDHQKQYIQKVLKDGINVYVEEETWIRGRSIWLGTWLVPLRDVSGNISGVMGVSRDITERKNNETELRHSRDQLEKRVQERTAELVDSQTQLRKLTDQLVTILEEERRRISRELYDEAGQALISLKYSLASIVNDIPEKKLSARQRLAAALDTTDQVTYQIRTLSHSLRPPVLEVLGINLSLKDYCEEFSRRTGLSIDYQGEEIPGLPDEIGISLYRFIQEAFTNITKHAETSKVQVRLHAEKKQLTLSVLENGRGMEDTVPTDGIGLIGIKERFKLLGGSVQIHAIKGQGMKRIARVPWPRPFDEKPD
jgi:two-component system, NarL family, sensor histidine kinase UhpB